MSQKPIVLYTYTTPNGYAVSAHLEELKAVYPELDYEYVAFESWLKVINYPRRLQVVDIRKNTQKVLFFNIPLLPCTETDTMHNRKIGS